MYNMQAFNVKNENEIAVLLSRLGFDHILDVVQNIMISRLNPNVDYQISNPNFPAAIENIMKAQLAAEPHNAEIIFEQRRSFHRNIIDMVCKEYNLHYNDQTEEDLYMLAFFLYDIFIGNFKKQAIIFFTNYIIREKNNIYNSLNLDEQKKNKDTKTIANKKLYADTRLAIITANMPMVMYSIMAHDITLSDIINTIYGLNKPVINGILMSIADCGDFYKNFYCPMFTNDSLASILMGGIVIEIQKNIVCNPTILANLGGN